MERPIGDGRDETDEGMTGRAARALPRRSVVRAGLLLPAAGAVGAVASCANSGSDDPPSDSHGPTTVLVALDEVPVGGVAPVTVDRRPAFVARPAERTVTAFSAVCTHQGCTVVAAGEQLMCPCHGSRFALLTGEVLRGPARTPLPPIDVRISGDSVIRA